MNEKILGFESNEKIVDGETIDGDFIDDTGLQQDIDQELNAIFSDFGGDENLDEYSIRIYRSQKGKGTLGYVFACLPSELPVLDKLRDEYGGGDFEVRVLKNNRIFRRRKVTVEPPIKKSAAPQTSTSDLMLVVQTMNSGFNRLGEMMSKGVTQQQQFNPMEMQTHILDQIKSMKELFGGGKSENPLKMVKDVMEVQSLLSGDTEPSTNKVLLGLVEQFGPPLIEMSKQEQRLKNSKRTIKPGQPKPQQDEKENMKNRQLKMQLMFLTSMAEKNADPYTYACMVLDQTPDNKLESLIKFISSENSIQEMAKVYPQVANYPEWFKELGQNIVKLTTIEEETEKTAENEINLTNNPDKPIKVKNADINQVSDESDVDEDSGREGGNKDNPGNNEGSSEQR
ncbi:MAG: hypothetical protein V3U02_12615 [Calditrichia bacterium]